MSDLDKALAAKSDQLCADDLYGEERTIRITSVKINLSQPQPIVMGFVGDDGKPWKPSKTQGRIMKAIWGKNEQDWVGKCVTVYREPTVKYSGQEVGGVFIKNIEGISKPTKLVMSESKHKKASITVYPLVDEIELPDEVYVDNTPILQEARDAASKGRDSFLRWWGANKDKQPIVKDIMDELKATAAKFDAANSNEEDPM